ncbi:MAG: hypothetical protein ACO3O0_00135 [Bacteroidia bacterium]
MSLQEDFEKIILETRKEAELAFLSKTQETILQLIANQALPESTEQQKVLRLIERMFDAEMEYLATDPEDYFEIYGD